MDDRIIANVAKWNLFTFDFLKEYLKIIIKWIENLHYFLCLVSQSKWDFRACAFSYREN